MIVRAPNHHQCSLWITLSLSLSCPRAHASPCDRIRIFASAFVSLPLLVARTCITLRQLMHFSVGPLTNTGYNQSTSGNTWISWIYGLYSTLSKLLGKQSPIGKLKLRCPHLDLIQGGKYTWWTNENVMWHLWTTYWTQSISWYKRQGWARTAAPNRAGQRQHALDKIEWQHFQLHHVMSYVTLWLVKQKKWMKAWVWGWYWEE